MNPDAVFRTARHIVNAYVDGDYYGAIVYASLRAGKSSYAIRLLAQIHGDWEDARAENGEKVSIVFSDGMNWDAWKDWMVYTPEQFIKKLEFAEQKGRQLPVLLWDDAGVFAANYIWQEEFGRAINMYTNVQATDYASVILTTPDPRWLLGHIRSLPGQHTARVNKYSTNASLKDVRYTRVYEGWLSPDLKKSGVVPLYNEWFRVKLPDKVFEEYQPIRRQYAAIAKEKVKEAYYKMKEKGDPKRAERFRQEMEEKAGIKIEPEST